MDRFYSMSGTHSTGKTTVINELKKLDKYKFLGSQTRTIFKKDEINTLTSDEKQLHSIETGLSNQIMIEEDTICDRSLIDTLAYTKYFFFLGKISQETYEQAKRAFEFTMEQYKHVFWYRIEFDLVEDGTRVVDEDFREGVDSNIEFILKQYNIPYTIVTGTVEERVQQVQDTIQEIEGK